MIDSKYSNRKRVREPAQADAFGSIRNYQGCIDLIVDALSKNGQRLHTIYAELTLDEAKALASILLSEVVEVEEMIRRKQNVKNAV